MAGNPRPPADLAGDDLPEIPPAPAGPPRPKSLPPGLPIGRFAGAAPPPKPQAVTRDSLARARMQMRAMRESRDWSGATPIHLVALYEWFHMTVYEVEVSELAAVKECAAAVAAAARLLRDQFRDDVTSMASFMRWLWLREEEREQWRRSKRVGGKRIGWRLQFSASLVTEWRVDRRRTGTPG